MWVDHALGPLAALLAALLGREPKLVERPVHLVDVGEAPTTSLLATNAFYVLIILRHVFAACDNVAVSNTCALFSVAVSGKHDEYLNYMRIEKENSTSLSLY